MIDIVPVKKRGPFPLHMTPFERYMFADNNPRYPMTFVVQFVMSGKIDRDHFQASIDEALARHPMLRSVVRPAKSNRECWVVPETINSDVDWGPIDQPILVEGAGSYIDLRNEIGVRTYARHDDQNAVLTFVFHHAAVDGIGGYLFLGDLLWLYASKTGEVDTELPPLDEMDLRKRMKAALGPELFGARDANDNSWENSEAQPLTALQESSVNQNTEHIFPCFHSHVFDKDEYKRLRLESQEAGQTMNDRLLQALFTAAYSWNQTHGSIDHEKTFAINMPLDLRQPENPDFSGINLVTNCFIHIPTETVGDPESLGSLLRTEIARIKYERHRSQFMQRLLNASENWKEAGEQLDIDICHSTIVFSNAGDPTKRFYVNLPREKGKVRAGNLLLEDINGVPPLRQHTRATISIFTYCRQLKICMRCDPFFFNEADGKAFLAHFVSNFDNR